MKPAMKSFLQIVCLLLITGLVSGCANFVNSLVPDVYLVDRHTVMEADAAGDWPQLEARLRADLNRGPQPLTGLDEHLQEQAAFQLLDDDYTSTSEQP